MGRRLGGGIWKKRIPEVRKLLESGYTLKAIGDKYNVGRQCIWNVCHRNGLNTTQILSKKFKRYKMKRLRQKIRARRTKFKLYGIYSMADLKTNEDRKKFKVYRRLRSMLISRAKFNLLYEDLKFPEYCPVLGMKMNYFNKGIRKDNSISIDRRDNTKGYSIDNIEIISWRANRLKSDGTADEHLKIAKFMNLK